MFHRRLICLFLAAAAFTVGSTAYGRNNGAFPAPQAGQTIEAVGILMETLEAEDLNDLQTQFGKRFGVGVNGVRPGTPGAAAGLKDGDIITAVNGVGVDSAAKAAALFRAATGEISLTVLAINVNTLRMESKSVRLQLGGSGGGARPAPAPPAAQVTAPVQSRAGGGFEGARANAADAKPAASGDPIDAYFNLMDSACSQAWSRLRWSV